MCKNDVNHRRVRLRRLPQEQGEASAHHLHGGAAAGATGQLPAGLQPGRSGPGAHRAGHRPQQAGDAGVVPEQPRQAEEAPAHGQGEAEPMLVYPGQVYAVGNMCFYRDTTYLE